MKVALLQLKTLPTPEENLEKIKQMLVQAKQEGADLAVCPKCAAAPMKTVPLCAMPCPKTPRFCRASPKWQGLSACMWLQALFRLRRMAEYYNSTPFVYD